MTVAATTPYANVASSPSARIPKLLVIDDDPELLRTFQLRFRSFDLQVLAAFHGMHGIWLATTEKPDVIITDVRMPQGEGSYVMQCLAHRAETAAIPVIVLTGLRDHEVQVRLLRLGAAKVFHKPVAFDALLAEMSKYVELSEHV
jgi:DNA-binding response OmpR family regulator